MIIGESNSERQEREARLDSAHREMIKIAERTGEPLEYIDPYFELDERITMGGLERVPKCCGSRRPLKPKEKK